MKNFCLTAVLSFASLGLFAGCGSGPEESRRVIIVAKPGVELSRLRSLIELAGGRPTLDLGIINAVAATIPGAGILESLVARVEVLRIDPDVEVHLVDASGRGKPSGGGSPPVQSVPWGVMTVAAPTAWSSGKGAGVVVAVVDTGVDKSHPDLAANVLGGVNFTNAKGGNSSAWSDDNGHGTHVSGTIAALDNAIGVVGVAPEAKLLAVKVLDRNGSGYLSWVVAGIDWAVVNGAQVVSMSLGSSSDVQSLHDACDNADAAGVLVVAAAGNSGDGNPTTDNVEYPGRYFSVVAVAATDSSDVVASFSSDGVEVDVCAPGVSVPSTWKGGTYATLNGTSMATPHVSGAGALLFGVNPAWSKDCVRSALQFSAVDLGAPGADVFYGSGLVNLPAALSWAAANCGP